MQQNNNYLYATDNAKKTKTIKIAIIGATGAVGRNMIKQLEKSFLNNHYEGYKLFVGLFASKKSAGKTLKFLNQSLLVSNFSLEKLKNYDYALMSAGGEFSKKIAKSLKELGIIIIDNSSAWRSCDNTCLIVPEINHNCAILNKLIKNKLNNNSGGIIANPNCSTIQLMVAMGPIHKKFGLEKLFISTYQSVSGTGRQGINELHHQSSHVFLNADKGDNNLEHDQSKFLTNYQKIKKDVYPEPIAFNLIPFIGEINDLGFCQEEIKMMNESKKILDDYDLDVLATTVRVPVFYSHGQTVVCKLKESVSYDEIFKLFNDTNGVSLKSESTNHNATPLSATLKNDVYISRIRLGFNYGSYAVSAGGYKNNKDKKDKNKDKDNVSSNWLQLWNVSDNLLKGAALNSVQILELVHKKLVNY